MCLGMERAGVTGSREIDERSRLSSKQTCARAVDGWCIVKRKGVVVSFEIGYCYPRSSNPSNFDLHRVETRVDFMYDFFRKTSRGEICTF